MKAGVQSAKHRVDVGGQKLQQRRQFLTTIGLVQYICDILCAFHWLEWGPLLPSSLLGLLGTISSLIQLYQHLPKY